MQKVKIRVIRSRHVIESVLQTIRDFSERVRNRLVWVFLPDSIIQFVAHRLARLVLGRRQPMIIGVTGTAGKTTTTQTIAAVLRHPAARQQVGQVRAATDNMNGHMGLPLVVLGYDHRITSMLDRLIFLLWAPWRALCLAYLRSYPQVLVLEYGTERSGYLLPLVELARPAVAIVTVIGPAHLEGLGTLEGVALEKGTLVRSVRPDGLVILGDGHEFVDQLERQSPVPVIRVTGRGRCLAENIARVVGNRFRLSDEIISEALASVRPVEGRLAYISVGGLNVIDDSFNANPLSMKLGLDALASHRAAKGRLVAVLGTMGELGHYSEHYHSEIGAYARQSAHLVIGVGEHAKSYAPDHWFSDSIECSQYIEELVASGDWVLVKGSASVGLSRVVERLRSSKYGDKEA